MKLGKSFKAIRQIKGLTQKEVAKIMGISVNALSRIEAGLSDPSNNTINNFCFDMKIPKSFILYFAIELVDLPDGKKEAYKYLSTSMTALITDIIKGE